MTDNRIELGDEVWDSISGFRGIVISRTEYLHGCVRMQVQPNKVKDDGSMLDVGHFDEAQLQVAKKATIQVSRPTVTGGPRPDPVLPANPQR